MKTINTELYCRRCQNFIGRIRGVVNVPKILLCAPCVRELSAEACQEDFWETAEEAEMDTTPLDEETPKK